MLSQLWMYGLASLVLLSYCAGQSSPKDDDSLPTRKKFFPPNFMLGAATSAYQIEGAWNVSGKSESIWDVFTHTSGKIKGNSTGDDACKSYEFYKCDTAMLRYLGVDFYRFSISWPRILPTGYANNINQAGIDHYNQVIDDLIISKIEPVVTIYHFDLPQCLQDLGGWANPNSAQWLEDYARVLFQHFGDRVKFWITINEPKMVIFGYGGDQSAPGIKQGHGTAEYVAAKNIVMAHARVWHLYDKEFRCQQKGVIGITMATDYAQGLTDSPDDILAAKDSFDFDVGIYAHPIFAAAGGFPPRVVQLVAEKSKLQGFPRSRLPEFTDEEKNYCRGTSDFYGFNHYSTKYWSRRNYVPEKVVPSQKDDLGAKGSFLNYPRTASSHIAVIPHGIRRALKYVKDIYNNPTIFITENGVATDEDLVDVNRIAYLKKYLSNVLDAIYKDQVDIIGYAVWSLMDNFEFGDGYKTRFGLFKVDYETNNKRRQARLSATWYRNLISTRTLDPFYLPTFEKAEFCAA